MRIINAQMSFHEYQPIDFLTSMQDLIQNFLYIKIVVLRNIFFKLEEFCLLKWLLEHFERSIPL